MARLSEQKLTDDFFTKRNEKINRFHFGESEIIVIKVGGVPFDAKRNFKWPSIGLRARPHGNFCGTNYSKVQIMFSRCPRILNFGFIFKIYLKVRENRTFD
jgi:hypothetical protein